MNFLKTPLFLLYLALFSFPLQAEEYMISTVAGTGELGYSGDGGAAILAQFTRPQGIAIDYQNDLIIADTDNYRIRKVSSEKNTITTLAGNGERGFKDEGAAATSTRIGTVSGLVTDSKGNLYFADSYGHRIHKVDRKGILTTVAGVGIKGFSGDGKAATKAKLDSPAGVAIDSAGNLYIADTGNHRIRKVSTAGNITTIAGDGTTVQDGVAITGPILYGTYGGDGGAAINAQLNYPRAVAVDSLGNVYIADTENHRIRKVDEQGIISTIAGDGTDAQLNSPMGLATDAANALYISDTFHHRVLKYSENTLVSIAGDGTQGYGGDNNTASKAQLNYPQGLAVDATDKIYVADAENHRIRKLEKQSTTSVCYLPPLAQAVGLDAAGNRVSSQTGIKGGVSINGSNYVTSGKTLFGESITFSFCMTVDSKDVGKTVDVFLVVGTEPLPKPYQGGINTGYHSISAGNEQSFVDLYATVDIWMAQLEKPFMSQVTLEPEVMLNSWKTQFKRVAMNYVFIGYRTTEGTIIYTSLPVMLEVE